MFDETANETLTQARHVITAYCSGAGLENPDFGGGDRLDLRIDGRMVSFCLIEDSPPALWIGCEIADVDPDDREALTWLLSAGLQPWFLRGERIGLIPDTSTAVTYTVLQAENIDERSLGAIVESLLEAAAAHANNLEHRNFVQRLN